jgi:hypothetical protein
MNIIVNYQQFSYLRNLINKDKPKMNSIDEKIRADLISEFEKKEREILSHLQHIHSET